MLKAGKAGIAILLALVLSLLLLLPEAFAQDTTTASSSVSASTQHVALTDKGQQSAQPTLPTSDVQPLAGQQVNRWCGWDCHRVHHRHFFCRWIHRGWGWWGRWIRVCRSWW